MMQKKHVITRKNIPYTSMGYTHPNTLYAKWFTKSFSTLHFVIPFTIEHFKNFCYNICIKNRVFAAIFASLQKRVFYNPKVETFSIFKIGSTL